MPSFSHSTIHGQSDVVRTLDDMILDGTVWLWHTSTSPAHATGSWRTFLSRLYPAGANFVSSFLGPDSFIYVFLREIAEEDQEKVGHTGQGPGGGGDSCADIVVLVVTLIRRSNMQ